MTHYPIVMQQGNNIYSFSWTYRQTHIRFYLWDEYHYTFYVYHQKFHAALYKSFVIQKI
jgi:hypothetical protein